MNLGAQSVTIVMGPKCQIGVVGDMRPDLRSSAFSDGIIVDETRDVKWSIMSRMNWPAHLMTSALKCW